MTKGPIRPAARRSLPGRPSIHPADEADNRTATIGLEMLQAVMRMPAPATLTEIARTVGMSVPTVSRYLSSLTLRQFLRRDEDTGKYDLGPAAIELGTAAIARIDAVRLATEAMRPLTESTNLASILAVWGSNGPTVIKWEIGTNQPPMRMQEGLNLSVVSTAVGRIFLTFQDRDDVAMVLRRDLAKWNANAPAKLRMSVKAVEKVRQEVNLECFSYVAGMNNSAVAAIAVPIFGPGRRLLMAMGLAGPIRSFDADPNKPTARALRDAAETLSKYVGYRNAREG
jgi:DNA-binding IclR family transcriptional regulator